MTVVTVVTEVTVVSVVTIVTVVTEVTIVTKTLFKASALWADAFYKSIPLPEVGCPLFLEIRNPWGKVMKISGLRYEHFSLEVV